RGVGARSDILIHERYGGRGVEQTVTELIIGAGGRTRFIGGVDRQAAQGRTANGVAVVDPFGALLIAALKGERQAATDGRSGEAIANRVERAPIGEIPGCV